MIEHISKESHNKTRLASLVISAALLLLISACATIEPANRPLVTALSVASRISLPFEPVKCLLDVRTGTMYALDNAGHSVYFYRDNKQIYSIGGFGNDKSSFVKLTDIAVDQDGNLLALDSFSKIIRKYSSSGLWITDIELQGFLQPEKLCTTTDGDIIVYDAAPKELSRISGFDRRVIYSFGKFQIENTGNIFCTKDFVLVSNEANSSTLQFSVMGQYIRSYPYQLGMDSFGNGYYYENGAVSEQESDIRLPLGWQDSTVKLMFDKSALLMIHANEVLKIEPTFGDN